MQTELNKFTQKTRKYFRRKNEKHTSLHSFFISCYRIYCSLTGFLHVLPDFYILGAEKCGTSSLYQYLIDHPCVEPCISKEPRYFSNYFDRGVNWYKIGFPFKFHKFIKKYIFKKAFMTGEATVRYLDHPHTPRRIKKLTPNAKFIILLRDPVDRAYSQYSYSVYGKHETLPFEDAIKKEKERITPEYEKIKKDENFSSDNYFYFSYLERGIYVDKLKHWMKIFPKEQFLILHSKDLFENTSDVFKQVLDFLGLPEWYPPKYKIRGIVNKMPPMQSSTRQELVEFFRPHNERLYKFLDINFHWDD